MCTSLADLPDPSLREQLAALVGEYAARRRAGTCPPLDANDLAAEDVLLTAADLLKAVDVTSFELAALFDV
jgi:hypothetical protein